MAAIRWERNEWGPYFRDIADRLRLRDWAVEVKTDAPSDHDVLADVHCIEGRKVAIVRLSERFLRDTEEESRHTVVHELLHLHLAHAGCLLWKLSGDKQAMALGIEYAVDGIADAIAPLMPLPSAILASPPASDAKAAS